MSDETEYDRVRTEFGRAGSSPRAEAILRSNLESNTLEWKAVACEDSRLMDFERIPREERGLRMREKRCFFVSRLSP